MQIVQPSFEIITPMSWEDILKHIERQGRMCYKSEDKITETSAKEFVQMIMRRGHESVLEHASFTVVFSVDRGITHELVRHRIASFSQESTRYCNYGGQKFGHEITYVDLKEALEWDQATAKLSIEAKAKLIDVWARACQAANGYYLEMLALGATPQIARSVLNNSTKAGIAITTNIREWRHILKLRTGPGAHPQMRQIMFPLLLELTNLCPTLFMDI